MGKYQSFTENYSDVLKGIPIVQLAAYKVLHEGLLGTLGKLGAAGLGAYGLYNYGGDAANWIGQHVNQSLGDTLGNWHQAGKEWTQDNWAGQKLGLGGDEAANRRDYQSSLDANSKMVDDAYDNGVKQLNSERVNSGMSDAEYQQRLQQLETQKIEGKANAERIATQHMNSEAAKNGRSTTAYMPEYQAYSGGSSMSGEGINPPQPTAEKQPAQQNQSTNPSTPASNPTTDFNSAMTKAGGAKNAFLADKQAVQLQQQQTGEGTPGRPFAKADDNFNSAMQNAGNAKNAFLDNKQAVQLQQQQTGEGNIPTAEQKQNLPGSEYWSQNKQNESTAAMNNATAQKTPTPQPEVKPAANSTPAAPAPKPDVATNNTQPPAAAPNPQAEKNKFIEDQLGSLEQKVNEYDNKTGPTMKTPSPAHATRINDTVNNTMSGNLRTTPSPFSSPSNSSNQPSVAEQVGNQVKNTAIHTGVNTAIRKAASSLTPQPKPPTNNGYGQGKQGQYTG